MEGVAQFLPGEGAPCSARTARPDSLLEVCSCSVCLRKARGRHCYSLLLAISTEIRVGSRQQASPVHALCCPEAAEMAVHSSCIHNCEGGGHSR